MSIIEDMFDANINQMIVMLKLENGQIIVSGIDEEKKKNKVLLIHPLILKFFVNDQGKETFQLIPYVPIRMVETMNFFIDKNKILSIHPVKEYIVDFYQQRVHETTVIMNGEAPDVTMSTKKQPIKKKVKEDANTESSNAVISFMDFKNRTSKSPGVTIYSSDGPSANTPNDAA